MVERIIWGGRVSRSQAPKVLVLPTRMAVNFAPQAPQVRVRSNRVVITGFPLHLMWRVDFVNSQIAPGS